MRSTTLASGAKALICKADDRFIMVVMPADRRMASRPSQASCATYSADAIATCDAGDRRANTPNVPNALPHDHTPHWGPSHASEFALSTRLAAVFHVTYFVWVTTPEHLGYQAIVIGGLIARMGVLEHVPVIGKVLFEATPAPGELSHHRVAPRWGAQLVVVKRLEPGSPAASTPHRPSPEDASSDSLILE